MEVNPLVFETSASTDSAIWATCFLTKIRLFPEPAILFLKKGEKNKKMKHEKSEIRKYNVL